MHLLVADSETRAQRDGRRDSAGRSSAESFVATLGAVAPEALCEVVRPHESGPHGEAAAPLDAYDAVLFSGSPLHVYQDTPEARRLVAFARAVFAAGTPGFGSCAGLQLAVAAAGGAVGRAERYEIGIARRICAAPAGRAHPLLANRPASWDALSIHSDVVERLPPGSILLAGNTVCPVQAVEIRCGAGMFWGVQYHPELILPEIAAGLRRQGADLVQDGFARTENEVEHQAALFDAVAAEPERRDLAWRLGIDEEITDPVRRRRELANFIDMVRARPRPEPLA